MYRYTITGPSTIVLDFKTIKERVPSTVYVSEKDKMSFEAYLKSFRVLKYTVKKHIDKNVIDIPVKDSKKKKK